MTDLSLSRKQRVVHLTLGLEMGGQEKLLVEFARHADRQRFDLHFVVMGGRGVLADDVEALGWPVTALNAPPGLRPGLLFRLRSLFRDLKADVVHTHDDRPHIYGAPAARLAGVRRVIHTRHGQSIRMTARQNVLMRLAARLTDHYVCVSEDSARHTERVGVSARRIVTILNGIDVDQFDYAGPTAQGPAVTVARLSPEKDVPTLLRAAALAVHQHPEFRLLIAGDGVVLPDLQKLADELALGEAVTFLGQVRDVAGLLSRASVFVLSSLSEGVSLTILEAMARGLPVVATRVGGNPEVVADGETGLLVPAASPRELAAALLRVQGNPDEGRHMGLAGRRRVEACFDVRRMVGEYERLYLGLPRQGGSPTPQTIGSLA